MPLPGDEFIDDADAAEELYILITHYVKHLSPEQQADHQYGSQNQPSIFSHSTLRYVARCNQVIMASLNRD
ncbi:hypothetical protein BBB57_01440 [Kosakonia sacchari]|jgi:hypothetical protein|nr:hypothetical protein C813_01205 [Kosakonia sacchari SP1]ANR77035.1 hypothetical protein BBB57_01440 [Kosakonia sacchari]